MPNSIYAEEVWTTGKRGGFAPGPVGDREEVNAQIAKMRALEVFQDLPDKLSDVLEAALYDADGLVGRRWQYQASSGRYHMGAKTPLHPAKVCLAGMVLAHRYGVDRVHTVYEWTIEDETLRDKLAAIEFAWEGQVRSALLAASGQGDLSPYDDADAEVIDAFDRAMSRDKEELVDRWYDEVSEEFGVFDGWDEFDKAHEHFEDLIAELRRVGW